MEDSCSRVRSFTGFSGLTTGTMASTATAMRTGFTPFFSAAARSLSLMSRELMATSHCFSPRALMPLPEPPPEITSLMSGLAAMKDSAAFCMTGSTVVEPLTTISWAWAATLRPRAAQVRTRVLAKFMIVLL